MTLIIYIWIYWGRYIRMYKCYILHWQFGNFFWVATQNCIPFLCINENAWAFTYLPHSPMQRSFCPEILMLRWIDTHTYTVHAKQIGPNVLPALLMLKNKQHFDVMASLCDIMWHRDVTLWCYMTSWYCSNGTRDLNIVLNYLIMKFYLTTLTFDLRSWPWPIIPA